MRKELHDNDWDLARRKHYTMLLTNKIRKALRRFPGRKHEFRIHIDTIASRYAKADVLMVVITNHVLNKEFRNTSPVHSIITRDSSDTPGIQLCDLMLGAVMETSHKLAVHPAKKAVRQCIADHLGWPSLDADTFKTERKFNIWYFLDTTREKRGVETKSVKLKYPYSHGNIS